MKSSTDLTWSVQTLFMCRLWKYDSFCCKCLDLGDVTKHRQPILPNLVVNSAHIQPAL